jgi:8-amino-7-oxononanoate synthase
MLDFTSALYLGLEHPSRSLPGWRSLTLGKPAALEDPPGSRAVERELAALTGCDDVLLATSTLHAFFDLFAVLGGRETAVFVDRNSYPISRWAAQHTVRSTVTFFGGHDADDANELSWALRQRPGVRPLVVTDGLSPASGVAAPIAAYASLAARRGGLVLVDDTQALGILGEMPGTPANGFCPYGIGGGGSLRHAGVDSDEVIVVNSLAKALGVPVAMVGGSRRLIAMLRTGSLMRKHCSPPSAAVIDAAAHALQQNRHYGEALRGRLARNVDRLGRGLIHLGLTASRSLFPVQPLRLANGTAMAVHARLLQRGVRTVLQRDPASGAQISFLLRSRHSPEEIDEALDSLAQATGTAAHTSARGVRSYDIQS